MRFSVPYSQLSRAVQTVARAISVRSPEPAATAIRLTTSDTALVLDATYPDLCTIAVSLPVTATASRQFSVPGKYFADVISRLGDGDVDIELAEQEPSLTVRWRMTEFVINGYELPSLPAPQSDAKQLEFAVSPASFRAAATRVLPATSNDDTRPVLTGVLLHISAGQARLVATDGFRLAYQVIAGPAVLPDDVKVVIPSRSLSLLNHILASVDDDAIISIGDKSLIAQAGMNRLASSLIAGQFPNYQQVMPTDFLATFSCQREDLIEACERASIAASEDNHAINLSFSPGTLEVSTANTDRGRMNERISCEGVDQPFRITFNARLFLDGLRTTSTDTIRIDVISETQLIRLRNEDSDDFCYIVLPLRRLT